MNIFLWLQKGEQQQLQQQFHGEEGQLPLPRIAGWIQEMLLEVGFQGSLPSLQQVPVTKFICQIHCFVPAAVFVDMVKIIGGWVKVAGSFSLTICSYMCHLWH